MTPLCSPAYINDIFQAILDDVCACLDNTRSIVEAFRPPHHHPCHRRTDGHRHGGAECQRPSLARDGYMDEELHASTVMPPEVAP
jgi:hypothetical protein